MRTIEELCVAIDALSSRLAEVQQWLRENSSFEPRDITEETCRKMERIIELALTPVPADEGAWIDLTVNQESQDPEGESQADEVDAGVDGRDGRGDKADEGDDEKDDLDSHGGLDAII